MYPKVPKSTQQVPKSSQKKHTKVLKITPPKNKSSQTYPKVHKGIQNYQKSTKKYLKILREKKKSTQKQPKVPKYTQNTQNTQKYTKVHKST